MTSPSRLQTAAFLCAARSAILTISLISLLPHAARALSTTRPTAFVFALVAIAIAAVPAIGFGMAAVLLPNRRRDVAVLAVLLAGADAAFHVPGIANAQGANHIGTIAWAAVDIAIVVLVLMSWKTIGSRTADEAAEAV